jgi:hypothetical protein
MRALIIVLLASSAYADSSVGAKDGEPKPCPDGPMRKDSSQPDIKKLAPEGMSLYQAAGKKHLLYSTYGKPAKSAVVERDSGKTIVTLDKDYRAALVESPSGKLVGVLALRDAGVMLHTPDGKEAWRAHSLLERGADSAATLVVGDKLIVASFHRIATGSSLHAYDLKSGALKWKADVHQLNVGHSQYWNDVSLELRYPNVVMRGFEAGGCYEQTFDVGSGRRQSLVTFVPGG